VVSRCLTSSRHSRLSKYDAHVFLGGVHFLLFDFCRQFFFPKRPSNVTSPTVCSRRDTEGRLRHSFVLLERRRSLLFSTSDRLDVCSSPEILVIWPSVHSEINERRTSEYNTYSAESDLLGISTAVVHVLLRYFCCRHVGVCKPIRQVGWCSSCGPPYISLRIGFRS